jgi:Protein of unknown function (DUF3455)
MLLGCGASGEVKPPVMPLKPEIPEALKAPPDSAVAVEARGVGVQIYECKAKKDDASVFEWTLKAPEADLLDSAGKTIGKHYAGPTWEATDGSKVVGAVKAKVDSPDAAAIPWLLLDVKSTEGQGVFAKISAVQRLATEGGKAPKDGCTAADAGKETRVPYKATYNFYAAK